MNKHHNRINYKTDIKFNEYLSEIEKAIPNITSVELGVIKKCFKKGLTTNETINTIVDFGIKTEHKNNFDIDYDFE